MSSYKKTIELKKKVLSEPKLIAEGILMYPEKLDLNNEETIAQIPKGSYVINIGDKSFVVAVHEFETESGSEMGLFS